MIAAIYARKSNPEERGASGDSLSVERQIEHGTAYATERGWTVDPMRIFRDDAISGVEYAKLDGRARLVAAAEAGRFDVLVVSAQDRLGRDTIDVLGTIRDITESDVCIFGYLDNREISVKTAAERMMTLVRGLVGETECEQTGKRVYDAAVQRVKHGHVAGAKIFGYANVAIVSPETGKKSHVVRTINGQQAAVVVRIFELYADGRGSGTIARTLNAERIHAPRPKGWSQTTVRGILRNPIYIGLVEWGKLKKVVKKGKKRNVPRPESEWIRSNALALRIVDEALWDRVQARREGRRQAFPRSQTTGQLRGRPSWHDGYSHYLWTGFGRCQVCQGNIRINHQKHGKARTIVRMYVCGTNQQRGNDICQNDILVRQESLDRALLDALTEIMGPRLLESAVDRALARLRTGHVDHLDRRTSIEREHQVVQQKIDRLVDALADDSLPADEIKARLKAEQQRKRALQYDLAALADVSRVASLDVAQVKRDLRAQVADVRTLLGESTQQARLMLRKILDGPIDCERIHQDGRRGFRGTLTFKHLLTGEDTAGPGSGLAVNRR
jgi:site-specific DNA recombinase